ncbi:hypothetical protein DH2020_000098 [Rehmannia glutinosa]|uniref:Protein kinase domain-containing protein n=1 Tax=Rehmannia glutinosa TaxID=99300 RepID=A0ABR0XVM2_REHGL
MMGCGFLRFSIRVLLVLLNLICCCRGFDPVDQYYINCGSSTDVVVGNTTYVADSSASRYLSTPQDILADSNLNSITPSDDSQLYRTARIFTGPSRYTFSIRENGRHWIRLHFYPFVYRNYDMNSASFSVFSQRTTLVSDFSPQNASVREYSVNVDRGDLVISFSPSANSFAYVNALEVVSVPNNLIETMQLFSIHLGRLRTCDSGSRSGFQYFIRFHFCDIVSSAANQLLFNVYVGTFLVAPDLELTTRTQGRLATPYFMDFVTPSMDVTNLNISIGPSPRSAYPDAFLNGLEIMKISNSRDSLSGESNLPSFPGSKNRVGLIVGVSVGASVALVLAGILFYVHRRRKQERLGHSKTWVPIPVNGETSHTMGSKYSTGTAASVAYGLSYRIPFAAVQEATNNFDENLVIGVGGFGKVYKGVLNDGTKIAVKRGNPKSHQGLAEFRTEIEMLSQFRHRHLVSLIGYCDEKNEMILVYEYMENGTVKSHLYGSDLPSLGWKERLEICIGAARGLHYLHTGYAKAVIHRDVKSANILLDENLMAKVADFGLSKTGPEIDQTHVSTAVKGVSLLRSRVLEKATTNREIGRLFARCGFV